MVSKLNYYVEVVYFTGERIFTQIFGHEDAEIQQYNIAVDVEEINFIHKCQPLFQAHY